MAIFIKGDKVDNATHYTLYYFKNGVYTQVGRPSSEINFNLSELRKSGDLKGEVYQFAVQASAVDFESSNFSNLVEVDLTIGNVPDEPVVPDEPDTPDEPVVPDEPDIPDASSYFNDATKWARTSIDGSGNTVTEDRISQSNIMPVEKIKGSLTMTVKNFAIQFAQVTYNDNGTFKARGSWTSVGVGQSQIITDANPFSLVIATKATSTSYSVAEMVDNITFEGVGENYGLIVYSDDPSLWVSQNMGPDGAVVLPGSSSYNNSNFMAKNLFTAPVKITRTDTNLYTAQITYDDAGKFLSRSSWVTLNASNPSVTYSDANPFNIIICTAVASTYTLEEMLSRVRVTNIP